MNNELIDQAIALLQSAKEPKKPREWWGVIDRDGDVYRAVYRRGEAEDHLSERCRNGCCGPYRLVHIVEVLP